MALSRSSVAALSLLMLAAAGCQNSRMASIETAPSPLPAAPRGKVEAKKLPPPAAPVAAQPLPAAVAPETEIAALPAALPPTSPPASAPEVTVGNVAGVWSASVSGQSCKVATPQTKFGQGFRAGPLRCPAPIDGVKSWNVAGKQLSLYDESGAVLARLYSSGPEKFDGQTESGLPISFTR